LSDATAPVLNKGTRAFSRFEWIIAGRYLRARRKEAFISVIASLTMVGLAIGVATLIVVMSVMNGFRAELLTKILGLNGHFTAFPIEREFTDYKETIANLQKIPGVDFAVYYVEGQVLASGKGSSTGVTVRGMDEENIKKLKLLYNAADQGGWDNWDTSKGIAIGYRLAQTLGE
jgi:lipoprotein-releasing system permease protein